MSQNGVSKIEKFLKSRGCDLRYVETQTFRHTDGFHSGQFYYVDVYSTGYGYYVKCKSEGKPRYYLCKNMRSLIPTEVLDFSQGSFVKQIEKYFPVIKYVFDEFVNISKGEE